MQLMYSNISFTEYFIQLVRSESINFYTTIGSKLSSAVKTYRNTQQILTLFDNEISI